MISRLFVLITACLLLAACATNDPAPTATVLPAETVVATATAAPTVTAVVTWTPQPTATPNLGNTLAPYRSEEGGYTLFFPDTWFIGDDPFTFFASSEAYADGIDPGETGALVAIVPLNPGEYADMALPEVLDDVVTQLPIANDLVPETAVSESGTNLQQQATVTLSGFTDALEAYTAVYTIWRSNTQMLAVIGTAPTERFPLYADALTAVADSVVLTQTAVSLESGVVNLLPFGSDDGSVRVGVPQGWLAVETAGEAGNFSLTLANSREALAANDLTRATDALLTLSAIQPDNFDAFEIDPDADAAAALAQMLVLLGIPEDAETVLPVTEIKVGALAAATTAVSLRFTDGSSRYQQITAVPTATQLLLLVATTQLDHATAVQPAFDQIAASIRPGSPLGGNALVYEGGELPFTLRYPAAWALNDADPLSLIFGSSADVLANNDFGNGGVVFVFAQETEEAQEPMALLALYVERFAELFSEKEQLSAPTGIELNGAAGAQATFAGVLDGDLLLLRYTAVARDTFAIVTLTLAPAGREGTFQPEMDALVNSIILTADSP